ncbi:MAG: E3 ubiquitin-protein ligase rad18 [Chrysothrix sp. TS-e1954]|nr:MAG: E3 ubiquitin-protein ligase rad18 [Chrysothrix sp. TS-e1954]
MDPNLPDPTDFLSTPLSALTPIDAALHCQICKDYLINAVITSCSHTFCSLCIRRCLAAEGRCPTCRAVEQEVKLRRNGGLQEVVDAFTKGRDGLLGAGRELAGVRDGSSVAEATLPRRSKRKREVEDEDYVFEEEPATQLPRTRSQRRNVSQRSTPTNGASWPGRKAVEIADSDGDDELQAAEALPQPPVDAPPDDGLVACPICSKRMKQELVFHHLDTCTGSSTPSRPSSRPAVTNTQPPPQRQPPTRPKPQHPPPERLPHLSYSLLKEPALRTKLASLSIPAWGPKLLLIRRHTEWVSIWNANCDSDFPKGRRELLRELEKWEKVQGGLAPQSGTGGGQVMEKDFDGMGWARGHKGQFDELIEKARRGRMPVQTATEAGEDGSSGATNGGRAAAAGPEVHGEAVQRHGTDTPASDAAPMTNGGRSSSPLSPPPPSAQKPSSDDIPPDPTRPAPGSAQTPNPRPSTPAQPASTSIQSQLASSTRPTHTPKKPMFSIAPEPRILETEMSGIR